VPNLWRTYLPTIIVGGLLVVRGSLDRLASWRDA
jgi:hypothetical protein